MKDKVGVVYKCSEPKDDNSSVWTAWFTWDLIKRHREDRAIVLTTHSMEEADMLCDRIAIMVQGRLAAVGTPLDLKTRFGVGCVRVCSPFKPRAAGASDRC